MEQAFQRDQRSKNVQQFKRLLKVEWKQSDAKEKKYG
jgi:hypothetical protein